MRRVRTIVEDDYRRFSLGRDDFLALADHRVFQAKTRSADFRDPDADVDRVGKSELAAVVARDRRQDRADPFGP